jgi:hypothetical protein
MKTITTQLMIPEDVFIKLMEISGTDNPEEAVNIAVEHCLKCEKLKKGRF